MSKQKKKTIIDVTKQMRMDSGLSIRALARKTGVSNQQISRWEKENDKIPLHRAVAIASACGVREQAFWSQVGSLGQMVDYQSECKSLVSMMDQDKLKALHTIMLGLAYK